MTLKADLIKLASVEEKKEFVIQQLDTMFESESGINQFDCAAQFFQEVYGIRIHDADFWSQIEEDYFGGK